MNAVLRYALNENNILVSIEDVEKGAACKCVCPHCKNSLYARKGNIREHHFAHAHGVSCENAYETTLHQLAKEIIMEEKCIMLPSDGCDKMPHGLVKLHDVKAENWDSRFKIRPDVDGIMENGERLLIEILVSHKVQQKKHEVVIKNKLKCIEIDLNYVEMKKSAIRSFLIECTDNRKWIGDKTSIVGDGYSFGYQRNPLHTKFIEFLMEQFENETIIIEYNHKKYDLKQYDYNVCEPNSKLYHGFKSDLLLYRRDRENKGYIAICIRGRSRNYKFKKPQNLRLIDIIIRKDTDYYYYKFKKFISEYDNNVEFNGFKEPEDNYYLKDQYNNFDLIDEDYTIIEYLQT